MSNEMEIYLWRQASPTLEGEWETLIVSYGENDTVLDVLRRYNGSDGATVIQFVGEGDENARAPMNINGMPSLASETKIGDLEAPVMLSPFESFPVVADLAVDMTQLKSDLDAAAALASASVDAPAMVAECAGCGVCHEAASEYRVALSTGKSTYMGPSPIMVLDTANQADDGHENREGRLELLMGERGVIHDRNTFTFDGVCPVGRDLVRSMTRAKRQTTFRWLAGLIQD